MAFFLREGRHKGGSFGKGMIFGWQLWPMWEEIWTAVCGRGGYSDDNFSGRGGYLDGSLAEDGDIWPAWGWSLEHLVVEAALGLERKILSADPFLFEGPRARTHSQVSEASFDNYSRLVLTIIFNWHDN